MSLLSIIQDHCQLHALSVPSSVVGSGDTQVVQLFAIVKELLDEIVTESNFNVTTQEVVFSPTAQEDQGPIQLIAANGYQSMLFETFFDRTKMLPLLGPLTETEWQQTKASPPTGTTFSYRIRQDHLLLSPVPAPPFSDLAFEYMSYWCVTDVNGVLKEGLTTDTDLFVFPEGIIRKGMMFRWKQIKGLPYQADETKYYSLLNNYIAKDKVKRRINLAAGSDGDLKPGIFVPTNSINF